MFKAAFPTVTYHSVNAKRRLLQMPVVVIRIAGLLKGQGELYLMEKTEFDYELLVNFLSKNIKQFSKKHGITKQELKQLLTITQSERERECIRYAIYKTSGASPTEARRLFGFENMKVRASHVETCIKEAQDIYEAIDSLARSQDQALLDTLGIQSNSSSESSGEETDCSSSQYDSLSIHDAVNIVNIHVPDDSSLAETLCECECNWFQFIEKVQEGNSDLQLYSDLEKIFSRTPHLGFNERQMELIVQSHRAFEASTSASYNEERIARSINGDIVSESDSEDPEQYVGVKSATSEAGKVLVQKKRMTIKRRAKRLRAKAVAERRFLSRKVSKRTSKILRDCPNIGETIESFVQDHSVGADAWRRTGVLTFDGNANLREKVTYEKIKQHLEQVYARHFAYGTVVELCVPRNKHRRSSKRYRGFAKVTSRRARKGFNLRYNPDTHWSSSFYKGLNKLEYVDGRNILNINRDDATGFRLDTMTTCRQYANPTVKGKESLTTRTDYVNKHPSVLQTTSYNFTQSDTTSEVCVGVVKAVPIHKKNPTQHFTDLMMLCDKDDLHMVFKNPLTGLNKEIDCIRVDGATDEGPGHELVQYWWTEWHFRQQKVVTLVTTRSSGSSYLNRVELQNGCLSLAHSNTFIPSTLRGSCINQQTGKTDEAKLRENLHLAIEAYISRVDGCRCGDATIKLYKGFESEEHHAISETLEIFLKGSNKQKEVLQREYPDLVARFKMIWDVRSKHMVRDLPSSYIFLLRCCYQPDCKHPVCQSRQPPPSTLRWYPEGPLISQLPLPVPDSTRPWGSQSCTTCKGVCAGHYSNQFVDTNNPAAVKCITKPPSLVLKQKFSDLGNNPVTDKFIEDAAKSVLLCVEETKIWIDHLATVVQNRKRGAAKAAATRRAKQSRKSTQQQSQSLQGRDSRQQSSQGPILHGESREENESFCGTCGKDYYTSSPDEFWIGCDLCNQWYCCRCEGLTAEPASETYICKKCCN